MQTVYIHGQEKKIFQSNEINPSLSQLIGPLDSPLYRQLSSAKEGNFNVPLKVVLLEWSESKSDSKSGFSMLKKPPCKFLEPLRQSMAFDSML